MFQVVIVDRKGVDNALAKLDSLPTLPIVASKVGELVNDPDATSTEIAKVMREDQSLTARVLALVNSAYYAIPGGVSDVTRAISYLGFNTVYQLVLTVSAFDSVPAVPRAGFDVKGLWQHSLGVAISSEAVAKHLGYERPEELFTAGILHDIGKALLASHFHQELEEIVLTAYKQGLSFAAAEKSLGYVGHDYIGRKLGEKWRLPSVVVAGIGFHHRLDEASRINLPRYLHSVADMVAVGDMLCRDCGVGNGGDQRVPELNKDLFDRLNLSQRDLSTLRDALPRAIDKSKSFLEILSR